MIQSLVKKYHFSYANIQALFSSPEKKDYGTLPKKLNTKKEEKVPFWNNLYTSTKFSLRYVFSDALRRPGSAIIGFITIVIVVLVVW